MKTTHTAGEWVAAINSDHDNGSEVHCGNVCVAVCGTGNVAAANARRIVRAVNCHDELVGALERCEMALLGSINCNSIVISSIAAARAALAKTKGEA